MATSFLCSLTSFRVISIWCTLIFALPPFSLFRVVNSTSFNFSSFEPKSNINVQGDASYFLGTIEFNKVDKGQAYRYRVGLITYGEKVRLWDKSSGKISDFSTHFTFVVDTLNRTAPSYGHGFTFFIAPVGFQIPPNSGGGYLGLFNTTTYDYSSSNQMIVVEFDSYANGRYDPDYEHVGINVNSIKSSVDRPWNAGEHSGDSADVWIIYNATTEILSAFWSYKNDPNFNKNVSISLQIDLKKVIPEWVNIGFSAATGVSKERHILKSWDFYSSLESTSNNDLHPKKNKFKAGMIVIVSSCAFFVILGGVVVFFLCRRRMQAKLLKEEETSFNDELERGAGPRRFSYLELDSATHNFSSKRKLGQGGFGGVYKGYLIDLDMPIAVKKISRGSRQGKKEYVAEVKIISRLRHRNLVQLIGWCHDKGEFLLVYEFMPNGSLDYHLFGNKKAPLNWPVRYKIALGLASGLFYLHEEWEQCVVHRDIKSSNIMLDSNFNVKLGDFGLATVMEHGGFAQTITLAGTLGYMAPEYMTTRKASKESDVYSFGVVALEIATGRRLMDPLDERTDMKGLIQWVWDLYGNGEQLSATDQKLRMEFDAKEVECLMLVGLWCVHPDYSLRPSIKQVIQVLNFEATLPSLPPTMPVPIYHVPVLLPPESSSFPPLLTTSLEVGR